ncbi:hypothetical protein ACH5RR_032502 [Cinchona calisaya]|uniref:RNase H type-1 domain-containing protein n=1 Tax=Cinchona calisaya TaxID=153742 RepID=A0ABD2YLS0_9GENT
MVVWSKPWAGSFEVNVGGSLQGNPGNSGSGGVIGDSNSYFLHGFSFYFGKGANLFAKAKALLEGLKLCVRLGIKLPTPETNSQLLHLVVHDASYFKSHQEEANLKILFKIELGSGHYIEGIKFMDDLIASVPTVLQSHKDKDDQAIWECEKSGVYSLKSAMNLFLSYQQKYHSIM